jgi:hypothetical protein
MERKAALSGSPSRICWQSLRRWGRTIPKDSKIAVAFADHRCRQRVGDPGTGTESAPGAVIARFSTKSESLGLRVKRLSERLSGGRQRSSAAHLFVLHRNRGTAEAPINIFSFLAGRARPLCRGALRALTGRVHRPCARWGAPRALTEHRGRCPALPRGRRLRPGQGKPLQQPDHRRSVRDPAP